MFHSGDADGIPVIVETDAVVSNTKPELRRFDLLEALDVAFAGFKIAGKSTQDSEGSALIDGTELSLGLLAPDDVLTHA